MSEGAAWVDRLMRPMWGLGIRTSDYNAIYSAVMRLGEQDGARLVDSIMNIRALAATRSRQKPIAGHE